MQSIFTNIVEMRNSLTSQSPSGKALFGQRMREARLAKGLPQDGLGVLIGLDEGCSSARISRYETGIHEPPFETAQLIAKVLDVPVAYFYCPQNDVAELLQQTHSMTANDIAATLSFMKQRVSPVD